MNSQLFRKRQVSLLFRASLLWLEKLYCRTQAQLTFHSTKYPLKTQSQYQYWRERSDVLSMQIQDMDHAYRTIDTYFKHRQEPTFLDSSNSNSAAPKGSLQHSTPWADPLKEQDPYLYPEETYPEETSVFLNPLPQTKQQDAKQVEPELI